MTTVNSGVTSAVTFTNPTNVSLTIPNNGRANISVASYGSTIYSNVVPTSRVIGPFPSGSVMTITALGAAVDYVKLPTVLTQGGVQIRNPNKISAMFDAIARSTTDRVHIGLHSHSIGWGIGAPDGTGTTAADLRLMRANAWAAVFAKRLNASMGGTPGFGIEPLANSQAAASWLTFTNGAALSAEFNRIGISGFCIQLSQTTPTYTVSFTEVTGTTVKVYADANVAGVVARVSVNGGADANVTGVASATPTGYSTTVWYEFTVTGLTPGTNTITFKPPTTTGDFYAIAHIDINELTTPGVTVHRLSNSGHAMGTTIGESLDATDVYPAGTWIGANGSANAQRRTAQTSSMTTRLNLSGVLCCFDVNDMKTWAGATMPFGWTLDDHRRHIANYVAAMSSRNIPILFICGPLRDPSSYAADGVPYTQDDLIAVYRDASDASTNAAFLDLTTQLGTGTPQQRYDVSAALTSYVDGLHWNKSKHAYYGQLIGNEVLRSMNTYFG